MNESEFCSYIRGVRLENGVGVSEIAAKYGWHRNTITNYEKDRLCDVDYLYALAKETGHSLDILLTLRLKSGTLRHLPELSSDLFCLSGYLTKECDGPREDSFLLITDTAMEPLIKQHSSVQIDPHDTELTDDTIYAISIKGEITARRVVSDGINKYLVAEKAGVVPILVGKDKSDYVQVVGRVCRTIYKFK